VVATVYYAASKKLTALYTKPALWSPAFGSAVYLFMNFLVLPFSAVAKTPFSLALFLNGIFGHAIFGLPSKSYLSIPLDETLKLWRSQ
jgi:uncharacterized membrane protein YagU involved in acid resistance